ncbi:hypothetical protein [Exiguobacterium sp. s166]|uniref:hypothetical protein n=1 Tax=Exiguobacterium sp. s166 TaxID=2751204 RepID=UPI001BE98807|nr:hypothetical protein [Exiguobacterium sp. s166]
MPITVHAVKHDGILHFEWQTTLLQETHQYVLVYGQPGRSLVHQTRQKSFSCATPSLECYDLQEGYTVNLYLEPDGERYYCNNDRPFRLTGFWKVG